MTALELLRITPLAGRVFTGEYLLSVSPRLDAATRRERKALIERSRAVGRSATRDGPSSDDLTAAWSTVLTGFAALPSEAEVLATQGREAAGLASERRLEFWSALAALDPLVHWHALLECPDDTIEYPTVLAAHVAAEAATAFSHALSGTIRSELAYLRNRTSALNVGSYGTLRMSFYTMSMMSAIQGYTMSDYTVGGALTVVADMEDMTDGPRSIRKDRVNRLPADDHKRFDRLMDPLSFMDAPWFRTTEVCR